MSRLDPQGGKDARPLRRGRSPGGGSGGLPRNGRPGARTWRALIFGTALLGACSNHEMYNQAHLEPLSAAPAFPDSQSALLPPAGTVDREPEPPGSPVADSSPFPVPPSPALLARGRERYMIYCSPCHGEWGYGDGNITRHGFPNPPSYHIPRLLAAAPGHFYRVITDGYGMMYSYAYRVPPPDRWAIIAYIRALQLSGHASLEDAPPAVRRKLEGT